jgi:mevalonate kinase
MPENFDLAFEIPSKTFIVGEYLAINGTASMLLATEPSFLIKIIKDKLYGFHDESPAGRLKKMLSLNNKGYSVFDPHNGRGGFGRSSAEYLAVYMHDFYNKNEKLEIAEDILNNLEDFISLYRKSCGPDYIASGADLVAQVCGGICWYDGMNFNCEQLIWPFPGYDILIFHTGKKLATHEHLKNLKKMDLRSLIPILIASRTSMDQANLKVFCESLNYYYDILNELNLSDPQVRQSVERLRKNPEILASKGCGAMGVDTVLVVCEKSDSKKVKDLCFAEDFQFISSLSNAHSGARFRRLD